MILLQTYILLDEVDEWRRYISLFWRPDDLIQVQLLLCYKQHVYKTANENEFICHEFLSYNFINTQLETNVLIKIA